MERVDLARQYGTDRQRRWRRGGAQTWSTTSVTYGRLADCRWFAERCGQGADPDDKALGACVFDAGALGEQLALRLAYSWMRDGDWRPEPAALDSDGRPVDGLPWVRRGGAWFLEQS